MGDLEPRSRRSNPGAQCSGPGGRRAGPSPRPAARARVPASAAFQAGVRTTKMALSLSDYASEFGLVAILRGVKPHEVVGIGEACLAAGFKIIEVPLNSPEPFDSIRRLADAIGDKALVGAGTVIQVEDVHKVAAAGGKIIVMPHSDTTVIAAAKKAGMLCLPGIATPTEAFAALAAGADGLKLFPAEGNPPPVLKAMLAVLPKGVQFFPVGGITPDNMDEFRGVGAAGFGLGSALYKPGDDAATVGKKAAAFKAAWDAGSAKL